MEKYWYAKVDPGAVDMMTQLKAKRASLYAMRRLKLPFDTEVRFFAEWPYSDEDAHELYEKELHKGKDPSLFFVDGPATGFFWGRTENVLWVRVDLEPKELMKAVLHEAYHAHELQYRRPVGDAENSALERRAAQFEKEVENLL